jgi:hypothetical protein
MIPVLVKDTGKNPVVDLLTINAAEYPTAHSSQLYTPPTGTAVLAVAYQSHRTR